LPTETQTYARHAIHHPIDKVRLRFASYDHACKP
jgi:hypothetical protein